MNEIQLYSKLNDPLAAIKTMGEIMLRSGAFKCTRLEQGELLAMICVFENKKPTELLRDFHVMSDGTISKKAMAALAEFEALGGRWKWINTGDVSTGAKDADHFAEAVFTYRDNEITVRHSIADAKTAGAKFVPGSNWMKHPGKMLRARVASSAVAMLAPSIYAGDVDSEPAMIPIQTVDSAPEVVTVNTEFNATPVANPLNETPKRGRPRKTEAAPVVDVTPAASVEPKVEPVPVPVAETPVPAEVAPVVNEPAAPVQPPNDCVVAPSNPRLPAELIAKLESAIPADDVVAAVKWLKGKGWIDDAAIATGEPLAYLTIKNAEAILSGIARFLAAVRK